MAHRCAHKLRLAASSRFSCVRYLHSTPACHDTLALPTVEYSAASSSTSSSPNSSTKTAKTPLAIIHKHKLDSIRDILSLQSPSPDRIWGHYVELLHFFGGEKIPLDIHQAVLRKCAPPAGNVRALRARRVATGRRYEEDQVYEARFQRIIRNIRTLGETPALEDYHRVLELFAATGKHHTAMAVLEEIGRMRLVKEPQTYALCLQALSYRLTLPVWHADRPQLLREVSQHTVDIINEMSANGVPYTAYNVDLAFRILKETMSLEAFTSVMRRAYGIDLDYPDRPPLEYWNKSRNAPPSVDEETQIGAIPPLPNQLPFSTSAFNSALDYLGSVKNVSKLVQMFEVLTNPLPSSSSRTFDDEEDDDFGVSNPQVAPYKPPHIQPNTTSFRLLMKGVSDAGHDVLARHYLLLLLEMQSAEGRKLRERTRTEAPEDIPSPCLAVNREIFLPVYHLANRTRNMQLMYWLLVKVKRTVRRKRYDIEHYEEIRARWIESGVYRPVRALEDDLSDQSAADLPLPPSSSRFSTFFSPSSSLASQAPPEAVPTVEVSTPSRSKETKTFDIDRHLRLLGRELEALEKFERHMEGGVGRTAQRIKERLGRRVWAERDIYLRDIDGRTQLSPDAWREKVNFRSQAELEAKWEAERTAKTRERQTSTQESSGA